MIKVYIPDNNINERIYIVNVLIGEFLGLDYEIIKSNKISWEIEIENGSKLIIQDYFFNKYKNDLEYLKLENIPLSINYGQKNNNQFIPEDNIPIIFGEDKLVLDKNSKTIICGIDIFASSFFMITRWEEYVNNIRDIHDRFPGKESIAYKFGFLDRPVVNEYVEMLWNMLKYLGLNQERKKREYKIILTHDVDVPFEIIGKTLFSQLKLAISDIIFRKNIKSSIEKIKALFLSNEQKLKYDKFYTFNYIMNQSEKRNLKNIFYFLPYGSLEQKYKVKVDNPIIIKIIQEIVQRGHEIGIHGSYETYNSKFKFLNEVYHLYEILDKNKIYVKINGGRQHYLRFKIPNTFYNYLEAGLE
nr:hypothetical protein [Candidatus Gracilibacteria bacterium]